MKKVIFTCCLLFSAVLLIKAQSTYYWVGGTNGTWSTSTSWNTSLDGSGVARTTANNGDVLIFDGTNIGGGATGIVTPASVATHTVSQLILQNGANVVIQRGTTSGTGTITISGDGGPSEDLQIDATSALKITSTASGFNEYVKLSKTLQATGLIFGSVTITDANLGAAKLIDSSAVGSLVFAAGSKCYINNTLSAGYPFGNSATSVSSSSYLAGGIVFKVGSSLYYNGGFSPFTQTTTTLPALTFEAGSNWVYNGSTSSTYTNILNKHYMANVTVMPGVIVNADAAWYNVDTLTVNTGGTFNFSTTGGYPITGNIINNGVIGSVAGATSSQIIMVGPNPQSVTGTGTFNNITAFNIGTNANVTLNANIVIGADNIATSANTSNIVGSLNAQGFSINSVGATVSGDVNFRVAGSATTTGSIDASSNNLVNLNAASFATGINLANVDVGHLVTGTNIPANTYIIGTSSTASQFTMSKAATGACTSFTISNGVATLTTANANGVDGTIATTGNKTFGTGVNYVFNTATTAPFSANANNATGAVTFNAAATTNKSQTIGGTITLTNGNLTINNTDTLRLLSAASIAGTSSLRYIVTKTSGATVGTLRIDGFSAAKTFPIGSIANYLPVTITPSALDTFNVSVFEGLTTNASPNGTAFNSSQKESAVDAVWVINPKTNAGQSSSINLGWTNSLAGTRFSTFNNTQIGIGRNNGSNWLTTIATAANNSTRSVSATYNAYGGFGIGELNNVLPVKLISFTASIIANEAQLNWQAANEVGIASYTIQKSSTGSSFINIGSLTAINNSTSTTNYVFSDPSFTKIGYYRLKIISVDGSITYSNVLLVKKDAQFKVTAYPNPVTDLLTISGLKDANALQILDMQGRLVLSKTIETNTNVISLNISYLTKGTYYLHVIDSTTGFMQILIKN